MLSKKRPILFDVMGHRSQSQRTPVQVQPRASAPARRGRTKAPGGGLSIARSRAVWAGLAVCLLLAVTFTVWRMKRSGSQQGPALQSGTRETRDPGRAEATRVFSVCAWSREYKTDAEREAVRAKVKDLVSFCYNEDPELFRDVRGVDDQKGTYRIYVGSASGRTPLIPLVDKLTKLVWKKERPFKDAVSMMIERGTPGSKETSDER